MTKEGGAVSDESPVLDEAYERMAMSGFELPNGFVNHGPMACEALAALGCDEDIDGWARRVARSAGAAVDSKAPVDFEWREALGDYRLLPQWIGHFERAVADDGWPAVVEVWVPRLMPALAVALFHGAIRVAHAVRAIDAVDTPARRAELARALGYWAARYSVGQPTRMSVDADSGDLRQAIVGAAAEGARYYLTRPNIFNLHGVTGAMAVELMVDHISADAGTAGLAQVRAEHASLYRGAEPTEPTEAGTAPGDQLARAAADSRDPHQVKLVEACRRGYAATGDPTFAAAAETVTGFAR
ncbi:MAG: questin oxidase family protein [Actinobacteria bacterium]|nr:MAG: questin oxidase family protein [Actinomycetota bacterium]